MNNWRFSLLCWLVSVCRLTGSAQELVQELGGGVGLQGVTYFSTDELNDRLFLVGAFIRSNNEPVSPGILEWRENVLHSVGCGIAWNCVDTGNGAGLQNPALTSTLFNGELFVAGNFSFTRNGSFFGYIMRWGGTDWQPVGLLDGPVKSLKVINNELIAAGWFTYADSLLVNGLARWDGDRWQEVHPVPPFYNGGGPNAVQDVEYYQGEWYIGGNLPLVSDLAKWTGSAWETVDGGFLGGISQINKLHVHDDRLYVAGAFARCPPTGTSSNPGSGIVAWNGSTWDDLGGGTCGSNNNTVNSITWWNDELYAAGNFNRMGGVEGSKLAKWDGEQWCMLTPPGFWSNGGPNALAVFHDSLYIGGAFLEAGGYAISCFGKWIGGDQTYGCGALAVDGVHSDQLPFFVFPNPGTNTVSISGIPIETKLILFHDALGREVFRSSPPWSTLVIEQLADGPYSISAIGTTGRTIAVTRFVKY